MTNEFLLKYYIIKYVINFKILETKTAHVQNKYIDNYISLKKIFK